MKTRLAGVSTKTRRAREAIGDIDYVHKLDDEAAEWLATFTRATATNSIDDMSTLVGHDRDKLAVLQKEIYSEDNAFRRDLMNIGLQAQKTMDAEVGEFELTSQEFRYLRCFRCLRCEEDCRCPARTRLPRYNERDYIDEPRTEDTAVGEEDLKRRMQAYDLLPFGDAPEGLSQGHTVKVCLPYHMLTNAWGYVLDYRPMSNEFLVRAMDRKGLTDKDGTRPKALVCWIKPNGLKRFSLSSAQVLSKSFRS